MLACDHYKRFNMTTYITPAYKYLWNGWLRVYNERNDLIYSTLETGLYAAYIVHLVESKECREKIGLSEEEARRILNQIEEEWKEVAGDC